MEASEIVSKLRASTFVFTEAQKIRAELKKLDDEDLETIVRKLRIEKTKPENLQVKRAIEEILFALV